MELTYICDSVLQKYFYKQKKMTTVVLLEKPHTFSIHEFSPDNVEPSRVIWNIKQKISVILLFEKSGVGG